METFTAFAKIFMIQSFFAKLHETDFWTSIETILLIAQSCIANAPRLLTSRLILHKKGPTLSWICKMKKQIRITLCNIIVKLKTTKEQEKSPSHHETKNDIRAMVYIYVTSLCQNSNILYGWSSSFANKKPKKCQDTGVMTYVYYGVRYCF